MRVDVNISEMLSAETIAKRAKEREDAIKLAEQTNCRAIKTK